MQKTGRPWYRKGTDSWYVWHGGRQVPLAKGRANKAAAFARFAELLGAATAPTAEPPPPAVTLDGLVEAYKAHLRGRVKPGTLGAYSGVLAPLVEAFRDRPAGSIRAADLEGWAAGRDWSSTTRRFALTVAGGAFRWAEGSGLIPSNPVRNLQKPAARSRGAEVVIDSALHQRLLSVASQPLRDFLEAVYATGARPGEVAAVEAKDVIWEAGCWVLAEHKTASTGKARTVFVPEPVLALCRRLADRHPTGPLFRNCRGEPWRKTGWKQAMARAQRKLGLPRRPLVSGYRHGFATDALEQGVPDAHVAELLGHTSTAMIFRHYGHLASKARTLRTSLNRVRNGGPSGGSDGQNGEPPGASRS